MRWQQWAILNRAFERLGRGIARSGPSLEDDWISGEALDAIFIDLPGAGQGADCWACHVAVAENIPIASLPDYWCFDPQLPPVRLRKGRAPHAVAQSTVRVQRLSGEGEQGTATCLVRDKLNANRNYVITCAHVAAPDKQSAYRDEFALSFSGKSFSAYLCEWAPVLGGKEDSIAPIDAALLELDASALSELRVQLSAQDMPAGVDSECAFNKSVVLHSLRGEIAGALRNRWSGKVFLADGDKFPDYFLRDAIGYLASDQTLPGDSGAAIWTADQRLLGMHVAAIESGEAWGANAVMGPISPVLDWYNVKPYTRFDPATITEADRPLASLRLSNPPAGSGISQQIDYATELGVLAKTIWGEARNQGRKGMEAVACVMANRKNARRGNCDTFFSVCRAYRQFSCWNEGDPNRRKLDLIESAPDAEYRLAMEIAADVLAGRQQDFTFGAQYYLTRAASRTTDWARGHTPCFEWGDHLFYNDVR
ncbi:cell wall hydrolase [Dechloromonas sp. CZR5]|uniref:cell wall hydrolase n=1 Tax=Dechloromonas sp. CZR5 TaxID=2608630 RepID=UPI001CC5710C|nr:cell wall hydrolase [Dechloromonas sp. CZR5]